MTISACFGFREFNADVTNPICAMPAGRVTLDKAYAEVEWHEIDDVMRSKGISWIKHFESVQECFGERVVCALTDTGYRYLELSQHPALDALIINRDTINAEIEAAHHALFTREASEQRSDLLLPNASAEDEIHELQTTPVPQEALDAYVRYCGDRCVAQEANDVRATREIDEWWEHIEAQRLAPDVSRKVRLGYWEGSRNFSWDA